MGKFIFWIIVIFGVLLCLRLYNMSQQKRAKKAAAADPLRANPGEAMVRCTRCGIYLPRSEAKLIDGAVRCHDAGCK